MPFIPHTQIEIEAMLQSIGVKEINDLFDEIPNNLKIHDLPGMPEGLSEMGVSRLIQKRGIQDRAGLCFIGAGSYEHHIPSAILDLISRGEFLTAYTPYQAEASQGTLQVIYEYQTMMANITGMDVSNASLYEGASALAEAILMAIRLSQNRRHVLIPANIHPYYRMVVKSILKQQNIQVNEIPYHPDTGRLTLEVLSTESIQQAAALVIPQPNFFGVLEEVDHLTDWAHQQGIKTIALVNPTALAILKEPGSWGSEGTGVDIVCGEGQPLGVPMASGGPYFGFLCAKKAHVRQMPGRIVGRTVDLDGKPGFTLTLQAREQHIRRSKATSNICTNQGLMVTAATIYMSLLGPIGLKSVASNSHHQALSLYQQLIDIEGVTSVFKPPFFHEFVIRLNKPIEKILLLLAQEGIQGGFDLSVDYPELGQCLLICVTETKTPEDITAYVSAIKKSLQVLSHQELLT